MLVRSNFRNIFGEIPLSESVGTYLPGQDRRDLNLTGVSDLLGRQR